MRRVELKKKSVENKIIEKGRSFQCHTTQQLGEVPWRVKAFRKMCGFFSLCIWRWGLLRKTERPKNDGWKPLTLLLQGFKNVLTSPLTSSFSDLFLTRQHCRRKRNGEATEKYYSLMKNSKRPEKLFSMEMDFQDPLFFFITFVVAFGLSLISFSFPKWSGVIDTPFILRKVLLHHPVLFTILKALSAGKWANFSFPSLPLASLGIIIGSKDMKTNVRFA